MDQFAELSHRVAALEERMSDITPLEATDVPIAADECLSKRKLAKRWDTSTRTIDRRRATDPDFPPAIVVNDHIFFWLSAIVRYERARAAR